MWEPNSSERQAALRKAAILVATLDRQTADLLLEKMGPDQAVRVRNAVLALGEVSAAEQQAVMAEFVRAGSPAAPRPEEGVELDESLARRLSFSAESPRENPAAGRHPASSPRFQALQLATADSVAKHLRREHPQIIAVVLAHLAPERAAEIIQRFPERTQVDVLRRVAELDAADPHVLRDLEHELEQLLADEIRTARNRSAGLSVVASILNAAGSERTQLLRSVSHHDEQLSSLLDSASAQTPHIRQPPAEIETTRSVAAVSASEEPVTPEVGDGMVDPAVDPAPAEASVAFEELVRLDDPSFARLLQAADPEVTLIALSGGSEALFERVSRRLSRREVRMLRSRMESLGPLRLADIEHAQRRLAQLADRLAGQGLLRLPPARRFAVAA